MFDDDYVLVVVKCQCIVLRVFTRRQILHAHSASADLLTLARLLGRDHARHAKLIVVGQHAQPEANLLRRELTLAHRAALDERRRSEVLETRARTLQRLTAAFGSRSTMLR